MLELIGLTRRFGGINAVDGVNLSVASGEVVGLIGQNGAGKTTILDLISGFQPLDGGRILLNGRDVSSMSPAQRSRVGLGRTFQGGRLFPGLTVAETVAVSLDRSVTVKDPLNAALRMPAAHDSEVAVGRRVRQLLELFGLMDYRDNFTGELSTGTRRIVELACVVALIVPSALRWHPTLTVVAAGVLAAESLVFIGVHVKYRERVSIVMSVVLGLVMAFIAYGRLVLSPIA